MGLRPNNGVWPKLTLDYDEPWIPFLVQCVGEYMEAHLEEVKRNSYLLKEIFGTFMVEDPMPHAFPLF